MIMNQIPDDRFLRLPVMRQSFQYSSMKFPLSALTVGAGHSVETSTAYRCDNESDVKSKNPIAHLSYGVWQYTLAGRGRIDFKTGSKDLLPGSLMIVSTPGPHIYYLPKDSDSWEFVFLIMKGREAIRLTRILELNFGNVLDTKELPGTLALLYDGLNKFLPEGLNDIYDNSHYTYRLFMKFFEEAPGFNGAMEKEGDFLDLIKFLKDNLHQDISVEEMAKKMNLSRTHFTALFSKGMNISPKRWMKEMRLKTAIELLFNGEKSIKEVAALCGFRDENYFCRQFKKRYGLSPGKYKGDELVYSMFNKPL